MTGTRQNKTAFAVAIFTLLFIKLFTPAANAQQLNNTISKTEEAKLEKQMIDYLEAMRLRLDNPNNSFAAEAKIKYYDSLLPVTKEPTANLNLVFKKAQALLEAGREQEAVILFDRIATFVKDVPQSRKFAIPSLALAYMRLAERNNCINNHSADACIMPIQGMGIHKDKLPAEKAIALFEMSLKEDPTNLDSRWLLNIAYMLTGGYPAKVPKAFLIPGLDAKSKVAVTPFKDIAADLNLDIKNRSGGMIIDNFNNDGNLDMVSSAWGLDDPMHYFKNNGDGTFTDVSEISGISKFKGGLNICQTDYNNDGFLDIFILRGGWQGQNFGLEQPNSLIRNNGDGTFTDVTYEAGIFSEHPTQTATWNDFNNDGWLDLFIGNETMAADHPHPCELFINNKNGTFTNMAPAIGLQVIGYAKGVTSGDYDNDGWADIFVSTLGGQKILLHNEGAKGNGLAFKMVSNESGFANSDYRTFPTWFFDYNNDGFLDIFMCNYEFDRALSFYAAKEALNPSSDPAGKVMLFLNNKNGTFTNATSTMDVNQTSFAMGANFGDIDNDGYIDFYLGTGNPSYQSIIPNRLYKNIEGKNFVDVTTTARVGQLQKGHGVSFADIDNNGTQDIAIDMGGAYVGDAYNTALYFNPGQGNNNWISLKVEGTKSNKQSIGAKITVSITENGKQRMMYREVNSGGSFGCSPLRQTIGIGTATIIDEIKINWPASGITQVYKNVTPNQYLKITEGKQEAEPFMLKPIVFKTAPAGMNHSMHNMMNMQ
ncbi:FG-GAP-like repeat-containing protein [Ferruginibacter sp. SUN106]|uniref:FG-GAP-like repeat-containing protein n=1 Tax=Ferruginibacter sp. SUN106 TaxID=2978348 RepID=UPI003D35C2B3